MNRIEITPQMDADNLAASINNNFRQIEDESRTKIITDENGQKRILIGRAPNGDYLIAITIPGKDVVTELENGG